MHSAKIVHIDASTFQAPIRALAETMALLVSREGNQSISAPAYTYADWFILIRQARYTYDCLFYLHADERRQGEAGWRQEYTFVCAPLVRQMIDDLYNITILLEDPWKYGPLFRKSGYRKALLNLDNEEAIYGKQPNWAAYIAEARKKIKFQLRLLRMTEADVMDKKTNPDWKTLGKYVVRDKKKPYTPHQQFLSTFTYGIWRGYSAISHGAFEGLMEVGAFFNRDGHRHEERNILDSNFERMMSLHIGRAALILLCISTEVQAHFRFKSANVNARILDNWDRLQLIQEAKEIYDDRYKQLMPTKGIRR
jgi:hypothetical protein